MTGLHLQVRALRVSPLTSSPLLPPDITLAMKHPDKRLGGCSLSNVSGACSRDNFTEA